ncbi:MAG TPA: amino acid adenylation domain-containing protein [Thermoanaerobaculia bacterium]|nr:amino acid adenylation domain-containing protein [Thermoanaerobaculia bacterium]
MSGTLEQVALQGFPLSPQQRRLWSLRGDRDGAPYRASCAVLLEGALDRRRLRAALERVVEHHESLRTTFRCLPGMTVPLQIVGEERRFAWGEGGAAMAALERPWSLGEEPPLRAVLIPDGPQRHRLILALPALCADARSLANLVEEIATAYGSAGSAEPAGDLMQYADVAAWQNEVLDAEETEAERDFWRQQEVASLLAEPLPFERAAEEGFAPRTAAAGLDLGPGLARAAPEAFLLACWQVLIGRLTGRSELVVCARSEGRCFAELAAVVGPLEKFLPVVLRWEEGERFAQIARRAGRALEQARAHQNAFTWDRLAPEGGLAPSLAFEVESPLPLGGAGGLHWTLQRASAMTERFALKLSCTVEPGGSLRATLHYDASRFLETDVHHIAEWLTVLARQAAAAPESAAGELELLTGRERRRELVEHNSTRMELPRRLLHELVREQAARTPGKVAIRSESGTLTFAELVERTGRLASRLRALGVGPEVPVAVHAERSPEMVVALLAILEAGGAWVPLDPDHPAERLAGILQDVEPAAVLTQERLAGSLPSHAGMVVLLEEALHPLAASLIPSPPAGEEVDDRLAYVIYTSGSTGRPKGVMVSHRAIVNRLLWMQCELPLAPDDRVLQKTPYGFDASIWEIFCPLLAGAELVLARPGGHQDSAYLAGAVAEQRVTVLQLVPSLLGPFLDEPAAAECRSLRRMFCGGEELTVDLARRFSSLLPDAVLHNLYGPTEAAIDATFHVVSEAPAGLSVPIGRPIANLEVYLLSPRGMPVPAGVAGELCIGGTGLARGYWRRSDQTAERFVPHPFSGETGACLYRTGDLARRRPDGAIEYLGRADRQVKVRGVRIEPREIEAVLTGHPEVRQAVVLPVPESEGNGVRLAAFVMPEVETAGLRRFLGERLPAAMMPAVLVPLRTLPLNPNGKLDTRALADAAREASEAGRQSGYVAPRTPIEQVLAEVWAEILGVERVGLRDDFFGLGGHSLRATQLVSRVRRVFQVELPVRDLFERPTVEALAAHLDRLLAGGGAGATPPIVPVPRSGSLLLSFAQQRLWFLEQLRPGTPLYNIPDAVRFRGPLDVAALATALTEVVRRHEPLRTAFPTVRGEAVQRIDPPGPLSLPLVDLSALPPGRRGEEAARRTDEEGARPFDLARGPLLRPVLFRLDVENHRAAFTVHHIVSDAWSSGVLVRELTVLYQAARQGEPSPLPELPVQYADFAAWQRRWLEGGALEPQLAWWREHLAGAPPVLDLLADRPRPERPSYRGATRLVLLPATLTDGLRALGRREGATLFMVVFAAFAVVLRRLAGRDDIVAGTDVANRNRAETEGMIGFFVNQLVLRVDLSEDPTFLAVLARVRAAALGAFTHQDVPFETLVDRLQVERSAAYAPLFQVKLFLENTPAGAFEMPELALERLDTAVHIAKLDLTLALWERPEGLSGWLSYNTDLFDEPRMVRLVRLLATTAAAAAAWPGARLSEIDGVLDELERRERESQKVELAKSSFQRFQTLVQKKDPK